MKPLVAVIIPTFNRVKLLEEAITSIQNQSFSDWEVIVVDDGSTDGTSVLMSNLSANDPRIRYIQQSKGGVSKARNLGISKTNAEYIAFLDDDDLFLRDKLKTQLDYFQKHPDLSFIYAQAEIIGINGEILRIDPDKPALDFLSLFEQSAIRIQTVMTTKKMIERVGGFDETLSFGEDYDLWLRMAQIAPFHFLPVTVVKFRIHGTNACNDHLSLYLQRSEIIKKIPVNSQTGITKSMKNLRLALNEYRVGRIFYENRKYAEAGNYFLKSIFRDPRIGQKWAQQSGNSKLISSFIKPYAATLYCWMKAGFSQR